MGREDSYAPAAVTLPPTTASRLSSSIRFLGVLKQPESDYGSAPAVELDERDVIWAPDLKSDPFDPDDSDPEPDPDLTSSSPVTPRRFYPNHNRGGGGGFGLSAVFADADRGLTVRRPVRSIPGRIGPGPDLVMARSAPVNVPTWHRRTAPTPQFNDALDEEDDGVEADGDGEMVPPHVIVARSHVTTFSVFEGVGRTLKGRDLRRVRNAVFQRTGFLD